MEIIFTKIFNMSVTASLLIIAVMLLRLIIKNAPKWTRYILWLLVALRLVIPFTFESPFSLVPNAQAINSTSNSSTSYVSSVVNSEGFPTIRNQQLIILKNYLSILPSRLQEHRLPNRQQNLQNRKKLTKRKKKAYRRIQMLKVKQLKSLLIIMIQSIITTIIQMKVITTITVRLRMILTIHIPTVTLKFSLLLLILNIILFITDLECRSDLYSKMLIYRQAVY